MKRIVITIFFLLANLYIGIAEANDYRIANGDVIKITVLGEPDLTSEFKIGNNGYISFPFIGEVNLDGLTLRDIELLIYNKLKGDYLIKPEVSVNIISYRPYFIIGEVTSPGQYEFQPNMSLTQAVARAGGYSLRANTDNIKVERVEGGKKSIIKNVSADFVLRPSDTVIVAETFF